MMKLGFSTLGCPECSISEIAAMAQLHGYGGIELRGISGEHIGLADDRKVVTTIRETCSRHGIEIFSITTYVDFSSEREADFQHAVDSLCAYGKLAQQLGATFVRTFIGSIPSGSSTDRHDWQIAQALRKVAVCLRGTGITLLVETHDRTSSIYEASKLIAAVDSKEVGILWDIPHSLRAGDTLTSLDDLDMECIGYVHLKDEIPSGHGDEAPVVPGTGIIPIDSILEFLQRKNYCGYICFEWERKWHPDLPKLEQVLPAFKSWVASAGLPRIVQ